ncbi:galactofuranosylgalactofuranosylrhamnosyl-N-acetylglucosaminyl-diphospho-decaprenol beta-1,5/1,6-galactofuranosyltransferase [Arthrobacter alpinus]|uniref:Galactofuranosylgalactofuranosylrhamnosyl-N-acetylglucosaminyl-diphospho-decaprenol beta-1,5/1,6-galactofuranosyltransferase n=2 Tax=Arthrobacter alpinus TaxID=656366 RepID=A0A1H5E6W8_9MICC|nr:galactofuranosylgalactofuranosylrhamnosyl-N-acetylglucosaminyl-diphospho-decaprenol beta-1,5/1,6-galactofuranosyltransferase [Arthrobacter alpinus]
MSVTENLESTTAAPDALQWRTLQRVILPKQSQMDTAPLYMDTGSATGVQLPTIGGGRTDTPAQRLSGPSKEVHVEDFLSRYSTAVRPGERVSFGTYFNAFPASYWRRWTTVDSVRLSVETSGTGSVIVYKSNARGALQRVDSVRVDGDAVSNFDLTLKPFGDGGWYWFDLVAGSSPVVMRSAEWQSEGEAKTPGAITLEITTLNKTDFCINNLRLLAENPQALEHVKELILVDQGTQKVADADGFDEVAKALAGKLRIIDQDNLGGSGGFARGMYEAVENGSDYALLMDDDVVVEPESIIRLLTFADLCKTPTIVGGHMFDLYNRTVLHTFGEIVNPYSFQPDLPSDEMTLGHDFLSSNLRQTGWLHRRADVDYNGWWMCMIPTKIIREIGLSLPVFIKWDDAEYGLRAKAAGYPTVSMPGAAVWHVSWIDKDDLVGWQAYFHARNRFIAALIHSPYEFGGKVVRQSYSYDVKHLVSMQYGTAQGRIMALRDLLAGPDQLHGLLPSKLPEIRSMMNEYSDSQFSSDPDSYPAPKMDKPPKHGHGVRPPSYVGLLPWAAKTVVRQLSSPVADSSKDRPQANVAHQDNRWWRMSQFDSAVVSNAEGTGASWYKRDPKQLRRMMAESAQLHAALLKDWQKLSIQYKKALTEITSIAAWEKTFAAHSEQIEK